MAFQEPKSRECFSGGCGEQREVIAHPSFGDMGRCARCGLVRAHPPRSASKLAALHSSKEYFNHPYFSARRNVSEQRLIQKHHQVLDLLTLGGPRNGAALLDIGCDTGSLLRTARDDYGMNVTGLEVNERAAERGRQEHGLQIVVGLFEEVALTPQAFDYITMIDLIEHLSDPLAMLDAAHQLLRPGGKLYILTPNHDALIHSIGTTLDRLGGKKVEGLITRLYIPWHEFYFDARTMAVALRFANLELRRISAREFPLEEFGHGIVLKTALWPVFQLQWLLGRQSLLEVVAERRN